jgi:hypothetical protein
MTAYELAKSRLDAREKETAMTCAEANEILSCSNAYVFPHEGKYMWMTIMSEQYGFDTLREAFDDVLDYLKQDGC